MPEGLVLYSGGWGHSKFLEPVTRKLFPLAFHKYCNSCLSHKHTNTWTNIMCIYERVTVSGAFYHIAHPICHSKGKHSLTAASEYVKAGEGQCVHHTCTHLSQLQLAGGSLIMFCQPEKTTHHIETLWRASLLNYETTCILERRYFHKAVFKLRNR